MHLTLGIRRSRSAVVSVAMRKSTLATILVFSAGIAAAHQSRIAQEVAPGGHYDVGNGISVDALGACSFDNEGLHCWDMDGKSNTTWGERIQGYYLGGNNDLQFKLRRKNRLLVLKMTGQNGGISIQGPNGGYGQSGQISDSSMGTTIYWIGLGFDPQDKVGQVQINSYNQNSTTTKDIPLKKGQTVTFEGVKIEIGAVEPAKEGQGVQPFDGSYFVTNNSSLRGANRITQKAWSLILGYDATANSPSFGYQPLDKDGKPILYVDAKGNAISAVQFLEQNPNPRGFGMPQQSSKYFPVRVEQRNSSVPGAMSMFMNVNPEKVSALRLTASHQRLIRFEGFPLDPK